MSCKLCKHLECHNFFNDMYMCGTYCDICFQKEKEQENILKKSLSIKDINDEATIFIIRKRNPRFTHAIIEFISHLQRKALTNETEIPVRKRKEVKKK